jgi:hypothetical protein
VAGVVHIPWYATGFRGDRLEAGLAAIAPIALRYGATSHSVFRYRDDRYRFLQTAEFASKLDFERYWSGPEFTDFRIMHSAMFQVPVVYGWTDLIVSGTLNGAPVGNGDAGETGAPDQVGDLAG